jgi:hypothetical protein
MREFNLLITTELPPDEGSGFLSPPTWTSLVELFFMIALRLSEMLMHLDLLDPLESCIARVLA